MRRPILSTVLAAILVLLTIAPARAATITLTGILRDFRGSNESLGHPDFEWLIATDRGIVQATLGAHGKPVYAGQDGNPTTHGQLAFDQWYRDTAGVNLSRAHAITLDNGGSGDTYTFADSSFFPIDGQLFGNTPGQSHNYHFTYELHTTFQYQTGQSFSYTGDDDVWVFINNQLVIDLGGVHPAQSASVDLDTLGLTPGLNYGLDLFFAERHTIESHFRMETSIPLVTQTVVPEPASLLLLGTGGAGLLAKTRRRKKQQTLP